MLINSARLVCFSPTGTTKNIVRAVAQGFDATSLAITDITSPREREKSLHVSEDEQLVIGVPVYMGRVPALLVDWFMELQVRNAPVVCVVVYGNRAYENALLELKDIVEARGGIPIAGAAFIGEHSFSSIDTPTAQGRPDGEDVASAEQFGRHIRRKLDSVSSLAELSELLVPGESPYGGVTTLWDVDFIAVSDGCVQCGVCAEVCPMGAIDGSDSAVIDAVKCITCCACIKSCPQKARRMKPGPVYDAAHRLCSLYTQRREPEVFL